MEQYGLVSGNVKIFFGEQVPKSCEHARVDFTPRRLASLFPSLIPFFVQTVLATVCESLKSSPPDQR